MTVSDHPKVIGDTGDIRIRDLALVERFIQLNKQLLLRYWEKDEDVMDPGELIRGLSKVKMWTGHLTCLHLTCHAKQAGTVK